MTDGGEKKKGSKLSKRDTDAPADLDLRDEPRSDVPSVVAHFALIAMLGTVLWLYRDKDAVTLGAGLTAVVVALIAVRFDRIKKLTSKLVSFETQPAVQQANAATKRANRAAADAQSTAKDAATAAAEAKAEIAEAKETLDRVRLLGQRLSHLSLDVLAHASIIGEFRWSEKIRLRNALKDQLRELGLADEAIAYADATFHALLRFQHAHRIITIVSEENQRSPEYLNMQGALQAELNYAEMRVPSPEKLREQVKPFMSETVEGALRDYAHFEETGEVLPIDMFDSETKGKQKAAKRKP